MWCFWKRKRGAHGSDRLSRAWIGFWPAAIIWMCALGCGASKGPQKGSGKETAGDGGGPIQVTATVGMVADLVRAVGGKHVQVEQLLGAGVDPHLYKPSRDDVRRIMSAELVVYAGLMLEGKMHDTLEKLATSQAVSALTRDLPSQVLLRPEGSGGHPDPHVWMDVELWSQCLDVVVEELIKLRPDQRSTFETNAANYKTQLAELHEYGKQKIGSIPAENRILITSHDAFEYFGRAYRIEVKGVQGISTESEAGLKQINELVNLLVTRRVPAVFVESSVPRKSIEAVVDGAASKGWKVKVAGPLYSDAMGESGSSAETYPGMLKHNFEVIAEALGGDR